MLNNRNQAARRAALMGSTALLLAGFSATAQAQDIANARPIVGDEALVQISDRARPVVAADVAIAGDPTIVDSYSVTTTSRLTDYLDPHPQTFAGGGFISPAEAEDTPAITINNNFSPVVSSTLPNNYDPTNITGIGQVITDSGGGFIGTCTGTLVNRRTIIFAAHCVNSRAATAYGANSGGVGAMIGFETNTRANGAGQTDELVRWLLGSGPNQEGRFQTNQAQQLYNISQIFWNPASRAPASCTSATSCFLEADIATAVLDTPTRNVPTWTMLFSPLVAPSTINPATGTGYHVAIGGYGAYGNGTTGSATSGNFRRRLAENILGGLASIDQRNLFLFGTQGNPARPQLLYWLDFDDPARGTPTANSRDFNGFRDNALTREGLTGPGDSGGPLVIDQAFGNNVRTIIGVLSGGSTFFNGQPGGSYGTQSFYQPLFLYWDWIVANNPYRYVTANGGARNWEDPTTWVTELDPAYQILVNGVLTNGLPTNLGGGLTISDPRFGEFCFQSPSSSNNPAANECEDVRTGQVRNGVPNQASSDTSSPAEVALAAREADSAANGAVANRGDLDGAVETPMVDYSATPRPAATIANGLPGATNFVANNVDGNRVSGTIGRYYDVTLRSAGNLTLSSAVTIDNFTIAGAQSQLTVATGGSLTSLVDVNQITGIVANNGTITSRGDYFFMSGLLSGTGRVNANFLTSVMGNFAPGTLGTIGTLTIGGNLVMASGSTYAVDLGTNGASDLIAVVANGGNAGSANIGGRVLFNRVAGQTVRFGDVATILTAQGGVTGTFNAADPLSAILRPAFIYSANQVQVRIDAVPYLSVINTASASQRAFATLLDQNRLRGNLPGIFDILDLQDQATVQSTLEGLAPRVETLRTAVAITALDNNARVIRDRLETVEAGNLGGSLAYYGRRVQTAALELSGLAGAEATMSDVSVQTDVTPVRLPEDMAAFIAAGYLEGESAPMVGNLPIAGNDTFDGFYVAAGLEHELSGDTVVGAALAYTDISGETAAFGQTADGNLIQATLYGKKTFGRAYVDGQFAMGLLQIDTERPGNLPGQAITLSSSDNSMTLNGEIGVGAMFGDRFQFGPRGAIRASSIDFSKITETGGATALTITREDYESVQGRAGLLVRGTGRVRPNVTATYVHEFNDRAAGFGANFAGGLGGNVLFNLAGQDKDWFEVSGGLAIDVGRVELSVSADTTLDRDDVENQSYRAAIRIRF